MWLFRELWDQPTLRPHPMREHPSLFLPGPQHKTLPCESHCHWSLVIKKRRSMLETSMQFTRFELSSIKEKHPNQRHFSSPIWMYSMSLTVKNSLPEALGRFHRFPGLVFSSSESSLSKVTSPDGNVAVSQPSLRFSSGIGKIIKALAFANHPGFMAVKISRFRDFMCGAKVLLTVTLGILAKRSSK